VIEITAMFETELDVSRWCCLFSCFQTLQVLEPNQGCWMGQPQIKSADWPVTGNEETTSAVHICNSNITHKNRWMEFDNFCDQCWLKTTKQTVMGLSKKYL